MHLEFRWAGVGESVGGMLLRWVTVFGLGFFGLALLTEAVSLATAGDGLVSPPGVAGLVVLAAAGGLAVPMRGAGVRHTAIALGVTLLLLVILTAPDLVRMRVSRNESATIHDLRALVSAQTAYSKANAGYFDGRLSCLERPKECLSDYRGDPAAFITADLALPSRWGYARTLRAGPTVASPAPTRSRTSVSSFAMTAVPVRPGHITQSPTGVRGFCADSSGRMCFSVDGTAPPVLPEGACDLSRCVKLE